MDFLEVLNISTAELWPATCKRASTCVACGMRKTLRISHLVHQSNPDQFITVRDLPGTPKGDGAAMGRLIRSMRKRARPVHWAWVVEPDTYSTTTHAHAYVRADPAVSFDDYTEAWASAATSCDLTVHVQKYTSTTAGGAYVFKHITRWNPPSEHLSFEQRYLGAREAVSSHLVLNGGRLVHQSRGFFRDESGESRTLTELTRTSSGDGSDRCVVYPKSRRGEVVRHLLETGARPGG